MILAWVWAFLKYSNICLKINCHGHKIGVVFLMIDIYFNPMCNIFKDILNNIYNRPITMSYVRCNKCFLTVIGFYTLTWGIVDIMTHISARRYRNKQCIFKTMFLPLNH